jgi:hypothetical protein
MNYKNLTNPQIAGIIVGALLVVGLAGLIGAFAFNRYKKHNNLVADQNNRVLDNQEDDPNENKNRDDQTPEQEKQDSSKNFSRKSNISSNGMSEKVNDSSDDQKDIEQTTGGRDDQGVNSNLVDHMFGRQNSQEQNP